MGTVRFFGQLFFYNKNRTSKEAADTKGYAVSNGYMGWVDGGYLLFADESDYWDYLEEEGE